MIGKLYYNPPWWHFWCWNIGWGNPCTGTGHW